MLGKRALWGIQECAGECRPRTHDLAMSPLHHTPLRIWYVVTAMAVILVPINEAGAQKSDIHALVLCLYVSVPLCPHRCVGLTQL